MDCDEGSESTIQEKEIPCSSEKMSLLDISDYTEDEDISDDTKYALINNRQPPKGFKFPARQSKDKRKPSGVVNRYCKEEWFTQFVSYLILWQKMESTAITVCYFTLKTQNHTRRNQI